MEPLNVEKAEPLNLEKGIPLNLEKSVVKFAVGLCWDVDKEKSNGQDMDLDLSCHLRRLKGICEVVFQNQMESKNGAVRLSEDNRTGEGSGDDEKLFLDLSQVEEEIKSFEVWADIFKADERGQHLGQVTGAQCHLYKGHDCGEDDKIATFNIACDGDETNKSVHLATLYREVDRWEFVRIESYYPFYRAGTKKSHRVP
ncbi:TerD domain-containing protein [Nemania abortiva]|nr:TerD domain-containing protein [Nemania abortiva]